MTLDVRAGSEVRAGGWLFGQPYLLLSLTALFWAGNVVLGRFVAGHIPPMTLSFVRWAGAFRFCCRLPRGIWSAIGRRSGGTQNC